MTIASRIEGQIVGENYINPQIQAGQRLTGPAGGVQRASIQFLREIEVRGKVAEFEKGHIFFNTGQNGHGLFLLEKGAVQTFRTSGAKKLIIAELKAPAVFGEMGCVGRCLYHLN